MSIRDLLGLLRCRTTGQELHPEGADFRARALGAVLVGPRALTRDARDLDEPALLEVLGHDLGGALPRHD
jgi:hypothetical protein